MKDYLLTLLVAAAVTYMLTPLVRRLAGRIGAMKEPRERDVHVVPVATLGGLAMYGGLAAGLLVADQIPQLRGGFANTGMVPGLLLAGGLLVVIGFIDDRWGMSPLPKAAGQVAAGGILVATGTTLSWFPLPGGNTYIPTPDQATLLTIMIVVATINAVNFIDGLDGLAAGIVAIAAISFFLYYYSLTKVIDISSLAACALASAILIGMCLGFLPHNFSPAKIFMGDTGSMLLGLLLAYAPISSITSTPPENLTSQINRYPVVLPLLLPAALLVIPYADLLLAVVRRTRAGRSPFAADRKHLHHRLLDIGHSQRASVLIMYLWAAVFSGLVVWLSIERTEQPRAANHHGEPIVVFVAVTAAAVVALLLMSLPRLRWWQRPRVGAQPGELAIGPESAALARAEPAVRAEPRLVGVTAGGLSMPLEGQGHYEPPRAERAHGEPARYGPEPADRVGAETARAETARPEIPRGETARGETARAESAWSAGIPAERPSSDPRLQRLGPSRPHPQPHQPAEPAQSLAFWRRAAPQDVPADTRRPTPALQDEWPEDRSVAGPARSIIGLVPPAVTGPPTAVTGPPSPVRGPAGSANADDGPRPVADGLSPDR